MQVTMISPRPDQEIRIGRRTHSQQRRQFIGQTGRYYLCFSPDKRKRGADHTLYGVIMSGDDNVEKGGQRTLLPDGDRTTTSAPGIFPPDDSFADGSTKNLLTGTNARPGQPFSGQIRFQGSQPTEAMESMNVMCIFELAHLGKTCLNQDFFLTVPGTCPCSPTGRMFRDPHLGSTHDRETRG